MKWQVLAVALISIATLLVLSMIIRLQKIRKARRRVDIDREVRATMIFLAQNEIIGRLLNKEPFEVSRQRDDTSNCSKLPCTDRCVIKRDSEGS